MITTKDITTITTSDAKTLTAAVKVSGFVQTLQGKEPLRVFATTAPTFSVKQPEIDKLLKPKSKAKLSKILTYHVVSGKMSAADLKDGKELNTVEGGKLKVTVKDGDVTMGGTKVGTTDINASHGVIHVIDKVLLPKD